MNFTTPTDIVLKFVDLINRHDVHALCGLMSENHVFIDSLGSKIKGREEMRRAWIGYFFMIPDYNITCSLVMQDGNTVGMFGEARGTYKAGDVLLVQNSWTMPASWRAIVKEDKIVEWQVYADNEPVRRIIEANT